MANLFILGKLVTCLFRELGFIRHFSEFASKEKTLMAEQNDNASVQEDETKAGEEQQPDDTGNNAETGDEQQGDDDDNSGDDDDAGDDDDDADGKADDKKSDKKEEDDDADPPVRHKTPADFILERKERKAKQSASKKQENNQGGDDDDDGGDDDISAEDEALVEKVINKKYGHVFNKVQEQEDSRELGDFLKENPEFEPYKAKIQKFWSHPSRNHLPVSSVAFEVAGKDLLKIGAQRQKKADDEAKGNNANGGGSGRSNGGGKKGAWDMSAEEFSQEVERVKHGQK